MKNVFLLFLFSIFGCLSASSKIIGYKLTNENGLPDYNIRYIEQDTEGYMYFVSLYAAYQYDGYTFRQLPDTVFHAYSNKYKNSLKDKLKGTIGVDKQGVLVYTDPNTKETIRLKIFPESIFNATVDVKCNVLTDRRGLIWISTNGNGLFVYDKRTKELTHLHKNDATGLLETNNIIFLTEDRNGNIWISFEKYGVTCLSIVPEEYQITHFNAQTEDDRENNARILRRLEDGRIISYGDLLESKEQINKYQVVFEREQEENAFKNFDVLHQDQEGRVYKLVIRGKEEEVLEKLKTLNPILLDVLQVNFEELFIYELESRGKQNA